MAKPRILITAGRRFPGFGIYCGVSNHRDRFWDISNAQTELGNRPVDDACAG